MFETKFLRSLSIQILPCIFIWISSLSLAAAVDAAAPATPESNQPPVKAGETNIDTQQVLRSYLQLQEQLHTALLAIEQTRQEADTASQRNAEMVSTRLKLIEQALTFQREREAEALRSSNRFAIIIASIIGGLGFVALILTAFFMLRAMKRLAHVASTLSPVLSGGFGESLPTGDSGMWPGQRLLGAIDRLEKRIRDMEQTSGAAPALVNVHDTALALKSSTTDSSEHVTLLLAKGQALLHVDKTEQALACFDEALAADPQNAEALVKKGTALERLKKLEEAIACYDQAIAINDSMTLAYLYKGGVCDQLERFNEALECYEKALRTQQRAAAS